MRQVFFAVCAVLLAIAAYAALPGMASAGPAVQPGQSASGDTLLRTIQYGGGGYGGGGYGGGNGGYRNYDDEYTPPPPPRPRYRSDPGWTQDGQPRFRYQRFTRDFCYHCASVCDENGCPQNCWGWRKYCPRPRW